MTSDKDSCEDINDILLDFAEFRDEWKKQAEGVLTDFHYKRCGLIEAQQAHHFLKALAVLEQQEKAFHEYADTEKERWETYTEVQMKQAKAEAWGHGWEAGWGDKEDGKRLSSPDISTNPYVEEDFLFSVEDS